MARYNTSLASTSISGTATIGSPYNGAFTELTGTAPYTVTLPSPIAFPGSNQTFYNATSGTITLSTPAGIFTGTGGSSTSTVLCYAGNVLSVTSDGSNYIVISEDGSALVATTGTFSGNVTMNGAGAAVVITPSTFTVTPTGSSNIDNVIIGASTRQAGSFTNLAANSGVSFTANIASSNTATGSLVVTGGVGVSGTISATALSASSITGTIQTAAQPNITSVGDLTTLTAAQSTVTYNTYAIPTATNVLVPPTLTAGYAYKIQLVTTGTGTVTGAVYIVRSQASAWQIFNVSNNGTSSNHPLLAISGNDLLVYHSHPSTYNVSVRVTSYYTGNASTGGTAGTFFGTDALIQNLSGNVNIPSAGVAIGTGSSPTATLDVRGGIAVSGWSNNNGGSAGGVELGWDGTQALLQSYNRSGGAFTPATINGSTVKLMASGSTIVTVTTTGLGVNTTPSYPLHVSGRAWVNNSSGDTGTRALGLTVSVNPAAAYSPGSDPGDTSRAMSIIAGTSSSYPAILGFRNIAGGTNQQMVDLVMDPNANKFFISRPGYTPWLSISNTTHDINTSRGFRNYVKSHSSTNSNTGGYQTSTNITQISDQMYEYGFYFVAGTGGYPTCPNSYWVVCPVQKQNTGSLAWAEVEIRGVHRGMWGASGYDEYASIVVGTGSDGGGIWVKEWKNGEANNSSNRIRVGWMNYDGVYNEGTNYSTGYNVASITGNNIGNSYYKMPLFLKIYTNCGADKEYIITVRTTNPDALGPPFKGALVLAPNTAPTSAMYW